MITWPIDIEIIILITMHFSKIKVIPFFRDQEPETDLSYTQTCDVTSATSMNNW